MVHGKPVDKKDAIAKIKALRGKGIVGTAFCVDKKRFENNAWITEKRVEQYVQTTYHLELPDSWIERYLEYTPDYLLISGGFSVEGYGAQFITTVTGSYSALLGLPLAELRVALEQLNFYAE